MGTGQRANLELDSGFMMNSCGSGINHLDILHPILLDSSPCGLSPEALSTASVLLGRSVVGKSFSERLFDGIT